MIPQLIRQNIHFGFYLINQGGSENVPFNRGKLLNVGFTEGKIQAKKLFSIFFL